MKRCLSILLLYVLLFAIALGFLVVLEIVPSCKCKLILSDRFMLEADE